MGVAKTSRRQQGGLEGEVWAQRALTASAMQEHVNPPASHPKPQAESFQLTPSLNPPSFTHQGGAKGSKSWLMRRPSLPFLPRAEAAFCPGLE